VNLSPQALVATTAALSAICAAIVAIRTQYARRGIGAINAVTFLWGGILYFVGCGGLVAAHVTERTDSYSLQLNLIGLGVVIAGLLGIALGSTAHWSQRVAGALPQGSRDLSKGETYALALILMLAAVASRYLAFGSSQFLLGSLQRELPRTWGNYVYDLRHAMLPAALLLVHVWIKHSTSRGEKFLVPFLLLVAIVFSFLQFSRRPLVLLGFGALVLWIHSRPSVARVARFGGLWLVMLGGVLFGVAVLAAAFRFIVLQASGVPLGWRELSLAVERLTPSFISLDAYDVMLSCVRWYREPVDWALGSSFVQVVTNPVPRALWDGKPESFGFTIAERMGEYTTNYGPTTFGEGFANFGLMGSLAFGWILGFGARVVADYQMRARTGTAAVLAAMVSFEFFPQVRGDLQGMTTPMLERIAFLAIGAWFVLYLTKVVRPVPVSHNASNKHADPDEDR
jgi:hypothetical protein